MYGRGAWASGWVRCTGTREKLERRVAACESCWPLLLAAICREGKADARWREELNVVVDVLFDSPPLWGAQDAVAGVRSWRGRVRGRRLRRGAARVPQYSILFKSAVGCSLRGPR